MNIIPALRERVERLSTFAELDVPAAGLAASAGRLSDASVLDVMRDLAAIANDVGRLQSVVAGVAASRSRREDGHSGLAATQGHASPAALVQSITGGSRADAQRQVRVGAALLEEDAAAPPDCGPDAAAPRPPWHEPLRRSLLSGQITAAQHDAIRGGLGKPIVDGVDDDLAAQAWALAAEALIAEASALPLEELAARARTIRDTLDPTGAEERFAKRYESRSLRMWVDEHGQRRGHLAFDDEMAQWLDAVFAAALRPRRGGPRFATDQERAQAGALSDDPRTNEQLQYDLLMDLLRAGALASAKDVFGARQPGVRLVAVKDAVGPRDAFGRLLATGHTEDGGHALPGSTIDRALCANGSVDVVVDSCGNPLDVGREQRLFTPKQKLALAIRDGGCLWPDCARFGCRERRAPAADRGN
ncbi:MAG: DUF222 domain-containing protein [Microbacterium sp.]|uniref:DUF222 domain-containing protein n=1 Tax=Microbacterium sp. TaxID=51671 RepID=UPI0039E714C3